MEDLDREVDEDERSLVTEGSLEEEVEDLDREVDEDERSLVTEGFLEEEVEALDREVLLGCFEGGDVKCEEELDEIRCLEDDGLDREVELDEVPTLEDDDLEREVDLDEARSPEDELRLFVLDRLFALGSLRSLVGRSCEKISSVFVLFCECLRLLRGVSLLLL